MANAGIPNLHGSSVNEKPYVRCKLKRLFSFIQELKMGLKFLRLFKNEITL
jgi:hypothetical protein